jgi:putative spermidine/putrescine transport system ATP-binding protein
MRHREAIAATVTAQMVSAAPTGSKGSIGSTGSTGPAGPGHLDIAGLCKSYVHGHLAVDHISVNIRAGEFFCLVGPSGCGKTTTLGLIAGHISPDSGSIRLGQRVLTDEPPNKRGIGFVFQDYALFPHMSVHENVVYGLKARKVPKDIVRRRGAELLELVGLPHLGDRLPGQLSGGQRQRVAVARALAIEPALLLLDEPLSNLDAQIRKSMQDELRRLHDEVGRTTIMVTHDQEEAFAVADRIAVMRNGTIEQVGSPRAVYVNPANEFVARFMGPANILRARVTIAAGSGAAAYDLVDVAGGPVTQSTPCPYPVGSIVGLVIRPESIRVETGQDTPGLVRGIVSAIRYRTSRLSVDVVQGEHHFTIDANPALKVTAGQEVSLSWPADEVAVVPPADAAADERVADERAEHP